MSLRLDDPSLPADLEPVLQIVRARAPNEACGVILQGPAGWRVVALSNVAQDPGHHFAFPDREWLAVLKEADQRGESLRCLFHSHPGTSAHFSPEDQRGATAAGQPRVPGATHLVVGQTTNGALEARLYCWTGTFFAEVCRATELI